MTRTLTYREALAEALVLALESDPEVFAMGVGVADPKGIFGTTRPAYERFPERVLETPISENVLTGACVGAALSGMRPVLVHARADFLFVAMDPLINNAAKWYTMSGGRTPIAITIRSIVGRGWGQGAQHSQSPQAMFAHTPGLKVVMPSTPETAKGLLLAAIRDPNPVLVIEHRRLYEQDGEVPEAPYETPIGRARIVRPGSDVTIVAASAAVQDALAAAELLSAAGIDPEVVDLLTISPLDRGTILESVGRTGRLVVADTGPIEFGTTAEVAAVVAEGAFHSLRAPVRRIGLPHTPAPTSWVLEERFYPQPGAIVTAVMETFGRVWSKDTQIQARRDDFQGPF